jgi:predicted nucleotidyltransferase
MMQSRNLAELLFGMYRRRILALLLLHPEQSFYVREMAQLVDVPPGSLHRELKLLAEAGLLLRQRTGNQVHYQANRDCPVFEELAGFFRKTAGLADILREALAPVAANIELAFVFGSVARGKEQAGSDVDVMVIGAVSFDRVVQVLYPTHARLGREVNPVVLSTVDFRGKFAHGDRFVSRIVNEPKLYLIGDRADLGGLAQNRPA